MGLMDDSSSSSSSDSENEAQEKTPTEQHEEEKPNVEETPDSPVVLDDDIQKDDEDDAASENNDSDENDKEDSSSSSSSSESSSSSSSESEDEDEKEEEKSEKESSSSSSSDSSSSSEEEEENGDEKHESSKEEEDMASSLAKALAEREKEPSLGARRPSSPGDNAPDTPEYMETPEVEAFNFNADPSIRARSKHDFGELPPALPPKARDLPLPPPPMIHDEPPVPSNIIHVDDNTEPLGRGRWSDDEESIPVPQSPDDDRRRRRRSSSRHRDRSRKRSNSRPKHTVIDVGRPYNHDVINPKAMVSLHSPHDDQPNYDSTANTGDELNKLIREANNMEYNQFNLPDGAERAEILYPSLRKDRPAEQNLNSKFLDAFTRIAPENPSNKPERTSYSGVPRPSENNHRRTNSSHSRKKKTKPMEVDGDDEISLDNEDFQIISEPPNRNISEIYPSDYTDFETASEVEEHRSSEDSSSSSSSDSDDGAVGAYDTVADAESELDGKHLNPIVNDKYQICTDIDTFKSKSFPRRIKEGKPKKERPPVNNGAISLSQFPRRPQGASLPYYHQDDYEDDHQIRRTGSADDMLNQPATYHPHITVLRDQPRSLAYDPVFTDDNLVRSSRSMPAKKTKPKKKKEKKDKEIRVQVNQVDASGNPVVNSNNLHVNLLPSSDPNVINLNIRSDSSNQPQVETITPVAAPIESQPVTIVSSEPQHRVVDVSDQPTPISFVQPVNPSAGDTNITSTTGVVLAGSLQPDFGPGMIPAMQFPGQPFVPASQLYPVIDQNMTQGTFSANRVIESNADLPPTRSAAIEPEFAPETSPKVVEIENPWPTDRHGSLPGHSGEPQLQGGDSGIDLSLNGRRSNRQSQRTVDLEMKQRSRSKSRREEESSSSSESSTDHGRRSRMSQKRLKSRDYVEEAHAPSMEYIQWYKSQYLRPSCMFIVIKHFFFVLNLLFTLLGLALVGLGIFGLINLYMNDVLHINYVVTDPLFTVLILGLVVTLIAFHGAAGFVRNNLCMLKFFGVLLIIFLLATIAGCITFWVLREDATAFASKTFGKLAKDYTTDRKGLAYTLDTIQSTFDCCGFDEKKGYKQWNTNSLFKCVDGDCDLPLSCCKSSSNPNFQCSSSKSSYLRSGSCISALSDSIRQYTAIIIAVWVGIWVLIILQFIAIFLMRKEIAYMRNIEKAVNYPEKNHPFSEAYSSEESEESSSEESSSSEDERRYKRRKAKKNKKKNNKRTKSGNYRSGSYHVNNAFSMDDERSHSKRNHSKKRRRRR